jgi:large conductance mechanosensitive channel
MLREFRSFLLRGNVIDLAIGIIAGLVFGAVVTSLVNDVLMQLVAVIVGKHDFSKLVGTINGTPIRYGRFLTAVLNFVLTMGAVFFFIVKPINHITEKVLPPGEEQPTQRECPACLTEVPAKATRCRACTIELTPVA